MAFVDAADPKLKAESRGVIEYELRSAEEHEQGLRARAGELHTAGWSVQVPVLQGFPAHSSMSTQAPSLSMKPVGQVQV